MRTPVLLALGSAPWEGRLVAAITRPESGIAVVRRCTDVAELLAVAGARTARVALVGAGLARLDRSTVSRLREFGPLVIGLADAGDPGALATLEGYGCDAVVGVGDDVASAVSGVQSELAGRATRPHLSAVPADASPRAGSAGRLVVVWGPVGAPGRSSVAIAIADESARAGVETVLVDADLEGPALAALLGLCDDVPSLAQAVRRADRSGLDPAGLTDVTARVAPNLRLLSGGGSPAGDWPAGGLAQLWSAVTGRGPLCVVDLGRGGSSQGMADPLGVGGSSAAVAETALAAADVVVAVSGGEPIGLARLVTGLPPIRELAPRAELRVVVTRVRRAAVGPQPEQAIRAALAEHLEIVPLLVPDDRGGYDAAVLAGRTLAEVAANSPARRVLQEFATQLRSDLFGADTPALVKNRIRFALARPGHVDAG